MQSIEKAKNILIIGCSYGVPNYYGPPGVPSDHHIEMLLIKRGHTVHNCSRNGASNLETLERTKKYLQGLPIDHPAFLHQFIQWMWPSATTKFDLVIWFHTELYRDFSNDSLNDIAKKIYKQFEFFFKTIYYDNLIVIGGAGDLHPEFFNYDIRHDHCIPSWRAQILGKYDLPMSTGLLRVIDKLDLSIEEKNYQLEKLKDLRQQQISSGHFPDGGHPGTQPHKDLYDLLIEKFKL